MVVEASVFERVEAKVPEVWHGRWDYDMAMVTSDRDQQNDIKEGHLRQEKNQREMKIARREFWVLGIL